MFGEFIYMLPGDTNLWIGKIKTYSNKILISSPSFKIGTNLKINLDEDKPDVKPKDEGIMKIKPNTGFNKEHKHDVKPNIKFKQDVKMIKTKPDTNKIKYEEEKVTLVLGITSVFTVWWMFK